MFSARFRRRCENPGKSLRLGSSNSFQEERDSVGDHPGGGSTHRSKCRGAWHRRDKKGVGQCPLKDRPWAHLGGSVTARPRDTKKGQSKSEAGPGHGACAPAAAGAELGTRALLLAELGHNWTGVSPPHTSCLLLETGFQTMKTHFSWWGCPPTRSLHGTPNCQLVPPAHPDWPRTSGF